MSQTLLEARALWLQQGCRRVLRVCHVEVRVSGQIPKSGLLVSNHLGYLDILVLSALTPCVFVGKRDVKSWPVFGWFALLARTLFADRERRLQVGELTKELRKALDSGALVVLFPEGTSSDGKTVLPFKSSLLEPATASPSADSPPLKAYSQPKGWMQLFQSQNLGVQLASKFLAICAPIPQLSELDETLDALLA